MGDKDSRWLEERIKIIERRIKSDGEIFSRLKAIDEIVEYTGWIPDSYHGRLMGLSIDRVIKMMDGNKRKNGEPYSQHCIMSLKEVSKLGGGKVTDITLALGALNHDNMEELSGYKRNKNKFVYADKAERVRISLDIEKEKREYKERSISFFKEIDPSLIAMSGLNINSLLEIEEGLTKRPDEYYHEYLERIFGRKKGNMPEYSSVLNILRTAIIKTAGDRSHNNSIVPRQENPEQKNMFTIPQRLKECYKSMMVVNRARNFMLDFPGISKEYTLYFDFLNESKYKLIKIADDVLSEDVLYLTPIIGEKTKSVIDRLFNDYKDYAIREPATENDIVRDEGRVFDGTLARFDSWIRKYRGKSTEPENIRLNPGNKRWMKEQLEITYPNMRAAVQAYMDCKVSKGVFEKFERDPIYTLKGFGKIND